jgi:guanylate kinase
MFKSKEEFTELYTNIKVLEWKEIEAPETWEQCE